MVIRDFDLLDLTSNNFSHWSWRVCSVEKLIGFVVYDGFESIFDGIVSLINLIEAPAIQTSSIIDRK